MALLAVITLLCTITTSFASSDYGWQRFLSKRPHANVAPYPSIPIIPMPQDASPVVNGTTLPPYSTVYYFDQLIDHNKPELGTFKQRYMFTWEFYTRGGPIVLTTPGEDTIDWQFGYLTNNSISGTIAQSNQGAAIVLEHRFFGESNPYPDLSDASLSVLTIEQALEDLAYFAKNVHLPFPSEVEDGSQVGPDKNPWIILGGSYAGALASWSMVRHSDVFHAGYASSAVVEAIEDYWNYFEPIRQYMPKNCSADVQRVIEYVDQTFTSGSTESKNALKTRFGMPNVTHYDDVAGALRNQLWIWQLLLPGYTLPEYLNIYTFCDALEVKNGAGAGPDGWGLDHALDAWGKFEIGWVAYQCQDTPQDECLGTYDSSLAFWHNTTVGQTHRSWMWICCNELGFWQDGALVGRPSIASRLITPQYNERQCTYYFPDAFPQVQQPKGRAVNLKYGGWDINEDRLFFVNAKMDPWREASVSSDYYPRNSTSRQPIYVLDSGFHVTDLVTGFFDNPDIKRVQDIAVSTFKQWISEYVPGQHSEKRRTTGDRVISTVERRDGGNSGIPSVDSNPPPARIRSEASLEGASPKHKGPKNAWELPVVLVDN